MLVLNSFILSLVQIITTIIDLYVWVIIIQSLISWVRPDPYNQIVQILYKLVYPAYFLVSKLPFRTNIGSIDLAPILIIIILQFISIFIKNLFLG